MKSRNPRPKSFFDFPGEHSSGLLGDVNFVPEALAPNEISTDPQSRLDSSILQYLRSSADTAPLFYGQSKDNYPAENGPIEHEGVGNGVAEPELVIVGPRQPSGHRRHSGLAGARSAQRRLPEERSDRSMSMANYNGGEELERAALSKNGTRTITDPQLAGVNKEIRRRIANLEAPGKIAFFLEKVQSGLGKELLPQLAKTLTFRKLNPRVPMSNYHIDIESRDVPLTEAEQARNAAAQSNLGAYTTAAGDVVSLGTLDNFTDDPEKTRAGMSQIAAEHPVSSTVGTVVGGALASKGLGQIGLAAKLGRAAPVVADTVFSAGYGAGSNDEDRLRGAVTGAFTGLVLSGGGRGIVNARRGLRGQEKYERDVAKYLDQGRSVRDAVHLASPYEGMGEHLIPRNASVTYLNRPVKLPQFLSDSKFNVLKPSGISRGDMYELHYRVDPNFYGTRLLTKGKGKGWSGKNLGLTKYGTLGKLWHGTSRDLKLAVAAPLGGAALYGLPEE